MVQFANSLGTVFFSVFYNVFYNVRYAAAARSLSADAVPRAIASVFAGSAWVSAACGLLIVLMTCLLVPRRTNGR